MIDNMLIVSPANEMVSNEDVRDTRTNILDLTELDVDFLARDDLREDKLASSDLDINAIDADFLGEDFLDDGLGTESCSTREGTKLCGTTFGLDNATQITTILSGDSIRLVRSLGSTVDVRFKKDENKNLLINSNGKSFLIEINDPAGGTIINVKQGD
jgi:hypothetical protein